MSNGCRIKTHVVSVYSYISSICSPQSLFDSSFPLPRHDKRQSKRQHKVMSIALAFLQALKLVRLRSLPSSLDLFTRSCPSHQSRHADSTCVQTGHCSRFVYPTVQSFLRSSPFAQGTRTLNVACLDSRCISLGATAEAVPTLNSSRRGNDLSRK